MIGYLTATNWLGIILGFVRIFLLNSNWWFLRLTTLNSDTLLDNLDNGG